MNIKKETPLLSVEVAYGTEIKQVIIPLRVKIGTTAYEAIKLSNIEDEFEGINAEEDPIGIFSKILDGKTRPGPKEYKLQEKDRVEIYRPLIIDPKEARLKRASERNKNKRDTLGR